MWIREEAEPLLDEKGRPSQLQGVMYDITEQKEAEERLMKALDTEKDASARLRLLHEMQNSFLQAVSHDLRTPLTSIMGNSITLEQKYGEMSEEDARDLLRRTTANARKLHRLLTNLLGRGARRGERRGPPDPAQLVRPVPRVRRPRSPGASDRESRHERDPVHRYRYADLGLAGQ
jgi:signal transduction histidine kinase